MKREDIQSGPSQLDAMESWAVLPRRPREVDPPIYPFHGSIG